MTYIRIDTRQKQAADLLKYIKTLPFATILDTPNATTIKAIGDAKKGKTKKHKNVKELIAYLNK